MSDLSKLNSASTYPPLTIPAADPADLKRGVEVVTRYFYGNSVPGRKAKVIRKFQSTDSKKNGAWYVRVSFGKNRSGQSLLKTFPICVIGLASDL